MKKIKRLNIEYAPLQEAFSLVVRAGSLLQVHSAETDTYFPDRQITPLVVEPSLYVHDDNGMIISGNKESHLTDVRWYENKEDAGNLIVSGQGGYQLGADGSLIVSKNVKFLSPVVLIFTANFYDYRTGNSLRLHESVSLSTTSLLELPVTVDFDKPVNWTFDPLTDSGLRTVTATVRLAGEPVEAGKTSFWWYIVENGSERLIDAEDLFYESGQNTGTLTIDPRYIEGGLFIRLKADYFDTGIVPDAPTTKHYKKEVTINRKYSDYDYEFFVNGSGQISPQTLQIKAESIVTSKGKAIASPENFFMLHWLLKSQVFGAEWRTIGFGSQAYVPREDYRNGAHLALDVSEKDPLRAAAISGDILTINGATLTL
jgi:hypothetical protein